jgi:hypothetical protein
MSNQLPAKLPVIPANAGIALQECRLVIPRTRRRARAIPAFAEMTSPGLWNDGYRIVVVTA